MSRLFAIQPHGLSTTHLDAICHHFYRGKLAAERGHRVNVSEGDVLFVRTGRHKLARGFGALRASPEWRCRGCTPHACHGCTIGK
jgi:hypothetical protein